MSRAESNDSSGIKTVFESVCSCFDAPVAPSRGQQFKEIMSRDESLRMFLALLRAGSVNVSKRGKWAANNFLGYGNDPL